MHANNKAMQQNIPTRLPCAFDHVVLCDLFACWQANLSLAAHTQSLPALDAFHPAAPVDAQPTISAAPHSTATIANFHAGTYSLGFMPSAVITQRPTLN